MDFVLIDVDHCIKSALFCKNSVIWTDYFEAKDTYLLVVCPYRLAISTVFYNCFSVYKYECYLILWPMQFGCTSGVLRSAFYSRRPVVVSPLPIFSIARCWLPSLLLDFTYKIWVLPGNFKLMNLEKRPHNFPKKSCKIHFPVPIFTVHLNRQLITNGVMSSVRCGCPKWASKIPFFSSQSTDSKIFPKRAGD